MFNFLPLNQLTAYVFWATHNDSPPSLKQTNTLNAEIVLYKSLRPKIIFSQLALSDLFEIKYLCYGHTAIINISILSVWGPPLDVRI